MQLQNINVSGNEVRAYSYWSWENGVPETFCDYVLNTTDWSESKEGRIIKNDSHGEINTKTRRTDIVWASSSTPVGCVLQTFVTMANVHAGWNYSIYSMEDIQLGKYSDKDNSFYDWHTDCPLITRPNQRKLSVVLMLSDPKDFEGGKLEIEDLEESVELLPKKGSIIVFPSFLKHRVTPVIKGTRHTAVGWMLGPSFK